MLIVQPEPGRHCYAHISSHDLVHWRHHPLALEPGENDTAIFSGGAFIDTDGTAVISYWALSENGGVYLATSTDDELDTWAKSPHNPIIPQNEHGYVETESGALYACADPSDIWMHDGRYYILTGNLPVLSHFGRNRDIEEHKGDTAYLFVSDDMIRWKYLHRFYASRREWTGDNEDCMCPDFFPLGDRHMLLFISHNHGCQYYIGRYENDRFLPETHGRMTWEDYHFFAPETLVDDRGRRILWAWIRDGREDAAIKKLPWHGTLSLPRVLWLGDDKTLRMAPPEELEALRTNPRKLGALTVPADGEVALDVVRGNGIELITEMESDNAAQFGVRVCCSPDGEEQTAVYYDAEEKKLKIDTTRSSLGYEGPTCIEGGPLELREGEPLRLRVFVDRSVVECFANDRQAVTRIIYPTRSDSLGVAIFSRGGKTNVKSMEAWDMAPSNPW